MKWYTLYARLAAALVAIIAMVVSFAHISDTARSAGEATWASILIAISLDGLIVVGIMAGIEDARHNRKWRKSGVFAFWVGIAGTMSANLASAEPNMKAYLVALVAPTAFLISAHVLHQSGKPKPQQSTSDLQPTPDLPPFSQDVIRRVVIAAELARDNPMITPDELASRADVPLGHARRLLAQRNGAAPDQAEPALATPAPTETS